MDPLAILTHFNEGKCVGDSKNWFDCDILELEQSCSIDWKFSYPSDSREKQHCLTLLQIWETLKLDTKNLCFGCDMPLVE